ncbi:MAG: hypothetical protein WCV67_19275 [Victivallaceae bacterium]|jgi:hypothetical protein
MNKTQPSFDLFQEGKPEEQKETRPAAVKVPLSDEPAVKKPAPPLKPFELKQAILGWLIGLDPSGVGTQVPTRISKYQVDVAAFWSAPEKQLLKPEKTMIVEIRDDREQCWPDCGDSDKLLRKLREKKEQKAILEAVIRVNEPGLKESDSLFDEYESWNYTASVNKEYQRCLKQIEKIQHSLYKGSRFEQIRRGHVADLLYLAVPAGEVHADELANGWGLLYIDSQHNVTEIKKAELQEPPESNRLHLIQGLAAAAMRNVLFAYGIRVSDNGKVAFAPPPRRRKGIK